MRGEIDLNDAVVSPFFVLASAVSTGLLSLELFGVGFSDSIFTIGSGAGAIEVTVAKMIAIAALGIVFTTNRPDLSDMSELEMWTAIATIGLVLAPPFMPAVEGMITGSQIAGIIAVTVQAGGFYSLSYLG